MERITETDVRKIEMIYTQKDRVEVYKVQMLRTNELLCMKKIYVANIMEATNIQSECIAMATLDHPNIIKLRAASLGGTDREITHVIIFMDFISEGDLDKLITNKINYRDYRPEAEIYGYLYQLIAGFAYMQEKGIAHRDVKPQNIFVSNGELKIGDLGSASKKGMDFSTTLTGTPLYLSPKLREAFGKQIAYGGGMNILHNAYKSDVFSLGLTFLYFVSLKSVKDLCNLNNLEVSLRQRIDEIPAMYPTLKYYLSLMLIIDEEQRPDFIQLKEWIGQGGSTNSGGNQSQEYRMPFELIDQYIDSIDFLGLNELRVKCEVCEKEYGEDDIFVFTSGFICRVCYEKAVETIGQKKV